MSWKKNAFSYLMWFVYTLVTGNALMGLAGLLCEAAGLAVYWGILFAVLYAAIAGGIVFSIRLAVTKASSFLEKNRTLFLVLEASWAAAFLALGLALRVRGIDGAGQSAEYYEAAKVAMGQEIPQIAHGAVYFYIRLLHGALTLFGNHFSVGVWLQIVLQMAAFVLLFFTVRKLAGGIAALVLLGFGMCSPYMVESALSLSPEMLFFFLISAVFALMTGGKGGRLKPAAFFLRGVLAALCVYLDVGGCLLFFPAFGFIFCLRREMPDDGRKAAALALCLAGACAGFAGCAALDSMFCGESFGDVADIWFYLYRPKGIQIPAAVGISGSGPQGVLLTGLMAFGIFSFWCDRKRERMALCTLAAGCVMLAGSLGIFTREMPGYFMLYVLFSVLAGLSVGQCFYGAVPELAEERAGAPGMADGGAAGAPGVADGAADEYGMADGAAGVPGLADIVELRTVQTAEALGSRADAAMAQQQVPLEGKGGDVTELRAPLERKGGAVAELQAEEQGSAAAWVRTEGQDDEAGADVLLSAEEQGKKTVRYIENPLPLPKKHVRRVLDFPQNSDAEGGEFDYDVSEDDDFDI